MWCTWKDAQHHSLSEKCKSKLQWHITSHWSEWQSSKKSTNNKSWTRCGERGTLLHCWWECKLVQSLWRIVWRCLKKLKRVWSSNPTLKHISKKNMVQKNTFIPTFIAALFTMAKTWKQPKCPSTEEWIKKMWYTHTHTHTHTYIQWNITWPLKRMK